MKAATRCIRPMLAISTWTVTLMAVCAQASAQRVSLTPSQLEPISHETRLTPEPMDLTAESYPSYSLDSTYWNPAAPGSPADVGSTGSSCESCGGGYSGPLPYYWENNISVLSRTQARLIDLSTSSVSGGVLLHTQSVDFDVAAGYDTTFGMHLGRDAENRDLFLEFTFAGLNNWSTARAVYDSTGAAAVYGAGPTPAGELITSFPATVGGFNRAEQHSFSYSADYNDFEMNLRIRPRGLHDWLELQPNGRWRRQCQAGVYLGYLLGVRSMISNESAAFRARGTINTTAVSGDYVIDTSNEMYGPQIGADLMFRECKLTWGVQIKIAPMINFADHVSRVRTSAAASDAYFQADLDELRTARKDDLALIGELNFMGSYLIRPNMRLRAQYQLLWITGMALAAEQFDFRVDPAPWLNNGGTVFSQGVTAGLECVW